MPDHFNVQVIPLGNGEWEITGEVHSSAPGGGKIKERKGAKAWRLRRDFKDLPEDVQRGFLDHLVPYVLNEMDY